MPDFSAQFNQAVAKGRGQRIRIKQKLNNPTNDITDAELFLISSLAILKDTLDWILLAAAGIGLILSRVTNLVITGILWLWCIFRLHKFPTKRFLGSFLVEMIPFVGTFSPTWTLFIVSIWIEQRGHLPKWADRLTETKP